jgi:hypothetical protein
VKEKAKNNYLGLNGCQKVNCALAVSNAFCDNYPLDSKVIAELANCGRGSAPGGLCGAIYAAKIILDKYAPDKSANLLEKFTTQTGSIKCTQIRSAKKLSCIGCVELAAEILEANLPKDQK